MAKKATKSTRSNKSAASSKYDAHHKVLSQTYGDLADLRRELADSRDAVGERTKLLESFATCKDPQKAWLLMEDFFEKLSLSRKDFSDETWWDRALATKGNERLEEVALLFLRGGRSLPTELMPYANWERLASMAKQEQTSAIVGELEEWLLPPSLRHLDSPRARFSVHCTVKESADNAPLRQVAVEMRLFRPRTGMRPKTLAEIVELARRSSHEQELYPTEDWEFIEWVADTYGDHADDHEGFVLDGIELVRWLTRWGHTDKLEFSESEKALEFHGETAELTNSYEKVGKHQCMVQQITLSDGRVMPAKQVRFFDGRPMLALVDNEFYIVRSAPKVALASKWVEDPVIPVHLLPAELVTYLKEQGQEVPAPTKGAKATAKDKDKKAIGVELASWMLPPIDDPDQKPGSTLEVVCMLEASEEHSSLFKLNVDIKLKKGKGASRSKKLKDIVSVAQKAAAEKENFSAADWEFVEWIGETYKTTAKGRNNLVLEGIELLQWLTQWGHSERLFSLDEDKPIQFHGEIAEIAPHLEDNGTELVFTQALKLSDKREIKISEGKYFDGRPMIALVGETFYCIRNSPSADLAVEWFKNPSVPVLQLSKSLLMHFRRTIGADDPRWNELCETHPAKPHYTFELEDDTVRLRLRAKSDKDGSIWLWNGHDWEYDGEEERESAKPEVLDDERLQPSVLWLRQLDWFTPEPGLWVGDATENFLNMLASAWPDRPEEAEYLGNDGFKRLFMNAKPIKPKVLLKGSGIDWLSVSTEWEAESLKLTKNDLIQLQRSTGKFVKLPDSGWVQLDEKAVHQAHEAMADLGVDGLAADLQKIDMLHASQATENTMEYFSGQTRLKTLKKRLKDFNGIPDTRLPKGINAELRPYQKDGFNFLCHLSKLGLGGVLADDMGLGKTLQTLTYLAWLKQTSGKKSKPALVIAPASVLHNWRREANKFTPDMKVMVMESGSKRHNLRKQIPDFDIIITNYAILRRDLVELEKFEFGALILDEAQYIKNPQAQVTQSVKQLNAGHRLALTGTPLENRMTDLWSIVDFVQQGYLGSLTDFNEVYEPKGENAEWEQKTARRRLSAKLRPIMLRRLKKQVAKDLPDRIEERRDCEMGDLQKKLYLSELRRSREEVEKVVRTKGLAKSKMHVLAALTRLRQICCHPTLVGNDSPSGKTETLMELLEPLMAEGQKVLVFSQFVQMLRILERECTINDIPTHMLTGETKNRQDVVNAFQADDNACVFLLSLRAAGTGLNLTNASYVVLYDPWWNPAVEAQAIDRSHRIGQTETVNAYRLITPGTVEEKIWDLQQKKSETIKDVLGEEGFAKSLSKSDLDYLFSD